MSLAQGQQRHKKKSSVVAEKQSEATTLARTLRNALWVAAIGPAIGGFFTLGGHFIDQQHDQTPEPTITTVSDCYSAHANVDRELKLLKVQHFSDLTEAKRTVLVTVNPDEVDKQCKSEVEIAKAILPA